MKVYVVACKRQAPYLTPDPEVKLMFFQNEEIVEALQLSTISGWEVVDGPTLLTLPDTDDLKTYKIRIEDNTFRYLLKSVEKH